MGQELVNLKAAVEKNTTETQKAVSVVSDLKKQVADLSQKIADLEAATSDPADLQAAADDVNANTTALDQVIQ